MRGSYQAYLADFGEEATKGHGICCKVLIVVILAPIVRPRMPKYLSGTEALSEVLSYLM